MASRFRHKAEKYCIRTLTNLADHYLVDALLVRGQKEGPGLNCTASPGL